MTPAANSASSSAPTTVRGRFLAATISSRTGELSGPLYLHAKVAIVDDVWLTLGSANLNDHSLFNDTEMNIVTCDPAVVQGVRLRLWSEHLECSVEDASGVAHHVSTRCGRRSRWSNAGASRQARR